MDIQRIQARSDAGDVIDATRGTDGKWSAKIDHADGDVHEDVPVQLGATTEQALGAALQGAIDSCP